MSEKWRGTKDLVCDAVDGTTELVETTHESVAATTLAYLSMVQGLGEPARRVDQVRRVITQLVTGSVRTANEVVRQALDLAPLPASSGVVPMRSDQNKDPRFVADAMIGVVNGLVGDHLRERDNGLDMGMQLRFEDAYFEPKDGALPGGKVVVFVHGLMATEAFWALNAEAAWGAPDQTYGGKLREELGYTPLFLRYNTGLHISDNGHAFARLLANLCEHHSITDLVLIGHSLGGLVARSATHYASEEKMPWLASLRHVMTLGSPHLGSPVAEGGHLLTAGLDAIDVPAAQIIATIGKRRSAAIKDLRRGYIVQEDWHGKDPDTWLAAPRTEVAFVDGVTYLFLGSTVTQDSDHPVGKVVGDLLVRIPSSTHEHAFDVERRVLGGLNHAALQNDPRVYEEIRRHLK